MRNRYEVERLAREVGVPLTETREIQTSTGPASLELPRPIGEVVDELREVGAIR